MGSAGVGKSHVLKCIYQLVLRYLNSKSGTSQDSIKILITAYTGKAAWNVDGITLHAALGLPHQQISGGRLNKLSDDILNTMRVQLKDLKLLVIDEISLCSSKIFNWIDERLKQIFENQLPFGGISVLLMGDLHQAKPVAGGWPFNPCTSNQLGYLAGPYLWQMFSAYELTDIMRQKDIEFVNCLNRMAKGNLIENDINILKTRHNIKDQIKDEAICLYFTNREVSLKNKKILNEKDGIVIKHIAIDNIQNSRDSVDERKIFDKILSLNYQETYGLPQQIDFKVGIKYMITCNVDVADGLFNGAVGVLKMIDYDINTSKIQRVWIQFPHNSGKELRRINRDIMIKQNIPTDWTPIDYVKKSFQISGYHNINITRTQFPLLCCEAMTIHKSQGSTFQRVIINLSKGLPRELIYTACSRVTSINGLYLEGDFNIIQNLKPNPSDDQVFLEIKRLQTEAMLQFLITPQTISTINNYSITYLNVQSLLKNYLDLQADQNIIISDILLLVETRTRRDMILLPNIAELKAICHTSNEKKNIAVGGVAIYTKENLKTSIVFSIAKSNTNTNWHYEMACIDVENIAIVAIYLSSRIPIEIVIEILDIIAIKTMNYDHIIICGDFNIEYSSPNGKKIISLTAKKYKWASLISEDIITTKYHSHIDYILSNNLNDKIHCYDFYGSYHLPFWINVSNIQYISDCTSLSTLSSCTSLKDEKLICDLTPVQSKRIHLTDTLKNIKLQKNNDAINKITKELHQEKINDYLSITKHIQSHTSTQNTIWLSKESHQYLCENMNNRERNLLNGSEDNGWLNDILIDNGMAIIFNNRRPNNCLQFQLSSCFNAQYQSLRFFDYISAVGQQVHQIICIDNHWLYIHIIYQETEINCDVFDSLNKQIINNFIVRIVSGFIKNIINKPKINYRLWHVTHQPNSNDCGIYAILNMAYNCYGISPKNIIIIDKSEDLRKTLSKWYESGKINLPNIREVSERLLLYKIVSPIYCPLCTHPDNNNMKNCINCHEKYHLNCQLIEIISSDHFICSNCQRHIKQQEQGQKKEIITIS